MSNIRQRTFDDKNDIDNLYKAVDLESDERQALSETVSDINQSLEDQGFINKSNNSYKQGYYSDKTIVENSDNVADTQIYECDPNKLLSIKYKGHLGVGLRVLFYDSEDNYLTTKEGTDTYIDYPPTNAKYFRYFLANGSSFPVSSAKLTTVMIGNVVDEVKESLTSKILKLNAGDNSLKIKKNSTGYNYPFGVVISGYDGCAFCTFISGTVGTVSDNGTIYGNLITQDGNINGIDGNRAITITAPLGIEFEVESVTQ